MTALEAAPVDEDTGSPRYSVLATVSACIVMRTYNTSACEGA
jgi:hypothetical protein